MKHTKRFVPEIIEALKNTSSTNEKVIILSDNRFNDEFKTVLAATYNPFVTFGIKKIPEYTNNKGGDVEIGKAVKDITRVIVSRQKTGNDAINFLSRRLEELQEDHAKILESVIKKDLGCGVSVSLINKAFGEGFIPVHRCMLADKLNDKTSKNI